MNLLSRYEEILKVENSFIFNVIYDFDSLKCHNSRGAIIFHYCIWSKSKTLFVR